MIGHQGPGVYFRPRLQRQLAHACDEPFPIQLIGKNGSLFDSPDDDMVQRPLCIQPGSPWHYSPVTFLVLYGISTSFCKPRPLFPIKQNAKQVLSNVESTLVRAVNCDERVPTNTKEDWYQELNTLGTPNCQRNFNQSPDGEWIRIRMKYNCPILGKWPAKPGRFLRFNLLNIDTSMVLKKCELIKKYLTFLTEEVPQYIFPEDLATFSVYKALLFTFSNKIISQKYDEIKRNFEMLLGMISNETDLILEDNLARGEIVRAQFIDGHKPENVNYFRITTQRLLCPVRPLIHLNIGGRRGVGEKISFLILWNFHGCQ